jgi:hypothetical protein
MVLLIGRGVANRCARFISHAYSVLSRYVNEGYNDVFVSSTTALVSSLVEKLSHDSRLPQAFFLNGGSSSNNVATLPDGAAVAINSVNCDKPYNSNSTNPNCGLFINNDLLTRTTEYNIEYDGFTAPLQGMLALCLNWCIFLPLHLLRSCLVPLPSSQQQDEGRDQHDHHCNR